MRIASVIRPLRAFVLFDCGRDEGEMRMRRGLAKTSVRDTSEEGIQEHGQGVDRRIRLIEVVVQMIRQRLGR